MPALELNRPLLTIGVVYGLFIGWLLVFGTSVFPELGQDAVRSNALTQTLLSLGLFLVMGVIVWRMGKTDAGWINAWGGIALAALAFLDLYLAFHHFHQGRIKPEDYFADRGNLIPRLEQLREQDGPLRFAQLRDGKLSEEVMFPRNMGYLHSAYEAPEGYVLFNLKDYNLFGGITNERVRLDIMNVGVIANASQAAGRVELMRYTNSLPRAKFYRNLKTYDNAKAVCDELGNGQLDYRRTLGVLKEECEKFGVCTTMPPSDAKARVRFILLNSDAYDIEYETTAPGVIFISESYYPGWKADGGKYPVIRAFGAFKGIVIPHAGSGVIKMRFSPDVLWIGLAISGTTLLGLIMVWVWLGRKTASVKSDA